MLFQVEKHNSVLLVILPANLQTRKVYFNSFLLWIIEGGSLILGEMVFERL